MGKLTMAIKRVKKDIKDINGRPLFNGATTIVDPGEAKELEQRYGKKGSNEFAFSQIPDWREGHRSKSFTVPAMPWKKE